MTYPLSRFAPSRCTAPDTLGAGRRGRPRPFLGVPEVGPRQFHAIRVARSAPGNETEPRFKTVFEGENHGR
ncbi:hypothetical protein FSY45_17505 [Comamonas sp. Z1]|nr:hypothetical protein FSY45_17505 [Comamonas sp. Z1]